MKCPMDELAITLALIGLVLGKSSHIVGPVKRIYQTMNKIMHAYKNDEKQVSLEATSLSRVRFHQAEELHCFDNAENG